MQHPGFGRSTPPLLLAVNKTDKRRASPSASPTVPSLIAPILRSTGCHSVDFVRRRLEKEMCAPPPPSAAHLTSKTTLSRLSSEALRLSRGSLADAGDSGGAGSGTLFARLKPGEPFSFAAARLPLATAGVSALRGSVEGIADFAAGLA